MKLVYFINRVSEKRERKRRGEGSGDTANSRWTLLMVVYFWKAHARGRENDTDPHKRVQSRVKLNDENLYEESITRQIERI